MKACSPAALALVAALLAALDSVGGVLLRGGGQHRGTAGWQQFGGRLGRWFRRGRSRETAGGAAAAVFWHSNASNTSNASNASNTSNASNASNASIASNASNASNASVIVLNNASTSAACNATAAAALSNGTNATAVSAVAAAAATAANCTTASATAAIAAAAAAANERKAAAEAASAAAAAALAAARYEASRKLNVRLLEAEADGFNSSLASLDRALASAATSVASLRHSMEAAQSSLVVVDEGGLNASRGVAAETARLAQFNSTALAFNRSDHNVEASIKSLDEKAKALKIEMEGKPQPADAEANADNPDLETQLERLRLRILANASALKYETFGRVSDLEKRLRVNMTLLADRVLRRRVWEELTKRQTALTDEVGNLMKNISSAS